MPQRLPRFLAAQQQADDLQKLARILLETGEPLPEDVRGKPTRTYLTAALKAAGVHRKGLQPWHGFVTRP